MAEAGSHGHLVVVGQGYVGLPLAMRAVETGWDVVGYEVDQRRTDRLAAGNSYVEDVSTEQLQRALATGRYRPTADDAACAGFDVAVITVPTPLREGVPDLSYIESATRTLGMHLRPGACVILESTTYPGTTEELVGPILAEAAGLGPGVHFDLGFSPERIDPGNPVWTFVNTPKIVAGVNEASLKRVQAFYDTLVDRTVPVSSPKEAELAKLLENTFRHVNIALVNEMAIFARDLDIDVWEALDAADSKPFGFMKFTPGPGVGGHCLPIDPLYLSWRVRRRLGHTFRFVELANDINDHMPEYVVRRVSAGLNKRGRAVNGSRILILGLAYKRNTGDAREAPARSVIERLLALGASVHVADAHVAEYDMDPAVQRVEPSANELAAADVVVLLTDHDDFDYDAIAAGSQYVFDTRRRMVGPNVEHL